MKFSIEVTNEFSKRIVLVMYPKISFSFEGSGAEQNRKKTNAPPLPSYLTHGQLGPDFIHCRSKHGGRELWVRAPV